MTETGRSEIVWRPTKAYAERSRVARFMRAQKIDSLETLRRRSVEDPEWYWHAVVRDLGVRWMRPYRRVVDISRSIPWPRWFEGGLTPAVSGRGERMRAGGPLERAVRHHRGTVLFSPHVVVSTRRGSKQEEHSR
jgi:acetyl-CoA synthetase